MRTPRAALDLIRTFESCRLDAYQDQGGVWTIGWGHARGVREGDAITQADADAMFMEDVRLTEELILKILPTPDLSDNQLGALVSFCYNVGFGSPYKDGFQMLKSGEESTLLKLLRAGDCDAAASEFLQWSYVAGKPCPGLLRRRLAEHDLFVG